VRRPAEPDDQPLTADPRPARGSVLDVHLGDQLELRKPHPCGSRTWTVVRLGADIGLVCTGCSRRVLLERPELERRLVSISQSAEPAEPSPDNPPLEGGRA
jgi:hypothetical protein